MNEHEKLEEKNNLISLIKKGIDLQSRTALEVDASGSIDKQEYNWEDLFNALTILMHIAGNITTSRSIRKWLNKEQAGMIATEFGKNIKQSIELATWIDTHMLAKRLYDND